MLRITNDKTKEHEKKIKKNTEELVKETLKDNLLELSEYTIGLQKDKIALVEQVAKLKIENMQLKMEKEHYENKKK